MVESAADIIFLLDAEGRLTYVNPAIEALLGYSRERLLGTSLYALVRDDSRRSVMELCARQLRDRLPLTSYEFPVVAAEGSEFWLEQRVKLLREDGAVVGLHGVARDVTLRKRAEGALRNLSLVDPETSLYNRRAFLLHAKERGKLARRNREALLLLLGWIEQPADAAGEHRAEAAIALGRLLRDTFRESDLLGRVGDARFAVLATEERSESAAGLVARLQRAVDRHNGRATLRLRVATALTRYDPAETSIGDTLAQVERKTAVPPQPRAASSR